MPRYDLRWEFAGILPVTMSRNRLVVWKGALWSFGGYSAFSQSYVQNVYRSTNRGETWDIAGQMLGAGSDYGVAANGDDLYVTGGFLSNGKVNTGIAHTSDGANWNYLPADLPRPLAGHGYVFFRGLFWVLGGIDNSGGFSGTDPDFYSPKVYSSPDNLTWTEVGSNALVDGLAWASVVEHQSSLWYLGGRDAAGYRRAVRRASDDMLTWPLVSATALPTPWANPQGVASYRSSVFLVGGYDGSAYHADVISSEAATRWQQESSFDYGVNNQGGALGLAADLGGTKDYLFVAAGDVGGDPPNTDASVVYRAAFTFTPDVADALISLLQADADLALLCPNGVFYDEAPLNATRFVIVSLIVSLDAPMFSGRAYEDGLYLVKAVMLSSAHGDIKAAAARINALLDQQPLDLIDGRHVSVMRRVDRVRETEVDNADQSIRWFHRGGRYQVVASGS